MHQHKTNIPTVKKKQETGWYHAMLLMRSWFVVMKFRPMNHD